MIWAEATLWGNRIFLRAHTTIGGGDSFDAMVDKCRAVSGGTWSKRHRCWSYPLDIATCYALRSVWGKNLEVRQELRDWFRETKASADRQAQNANRLDATLVRVPSLAPKLSSTLRPDQRAGAAWLASSYRGGALLADEPGLGKTLETIAGVLEADVRGPILVVCPKASVDLVWRREWERWTSVPVYACTGTRRSREKTIEAFLRDTGVRKVLVVVAEMLRVTAVKDPGQPKRRVVVDFEYPQLFEGIEWSAVVLDESHKLLGSLTVSKGNLMGEGLRRLPYAPGCLRIAVSGTPFGKGGKVQGMFGTLHWLWKEEFPSFWRWVDNHFEVAEVFVGRGKTARKIVGLREKEGGAEKFLQSLGPRIMRRTKAELLPNLPPKRYIEVLCQMGPRQLRQYREMADNAELLTEGGVLVANGVLAAITRAKQLANGVVDVTPEGVRFTGESCKIDALMDRLEERGILGGDGEVKVLVSSQFNVFLHAVEDRLKAAGVAYHMLTGATRDRERTLMVDRFQKEKEGPRVFLLNSKAGGVSITLDAADEVHCLDEMWSPEDNQQLEDRAHRASRNHQVDIYNYRTVGTIDQAIAEDVENKRFQQFRVLDGRRGLEYFRRLINNTG